MVFKIPSDPPGLEAPQPPYRRQRAAVRAEDREPGFHGPDRAAADTRLKVWPEQRYDLIAVAHERHRFLK
jgi:hypothetical protein